MTTAASGPAGRIVADAEAAIGIDLIFDHSTDEIIGNKSTERDKELIRRIQYAKAQFVLGALDARTPLSKQNTDFQADFLKRASLRPLRIGHKRASLRPHHLRIGHLYFDENHDPFMISDDVVRFRATPIAGNPTLNSFAEELAAADTGYYWLPKSRYISWLLTPNNNTETFFSLSAEQILAWDEHLLKRLLAGKIVIIGADLPDRDQHLTPLSVTNGQRYTGLFIHAQILAQLLDEGKKRYPVNELNWLEKSIILLIAFCGGTWVGLRDRWGGYQLFVELLGILALILIGFAVFWAFRLIFPILLTLLFLLAGFTFGHYSSHFLKGQVEPH